MRPFPQPDGHDDPGLFDKAVPGVAAMVEDIPIGREDSVREPVVADELPGVLDRALSEQNSEYLRIIRR